MQNRLPPLNALVVFEAAARHLSFTRAAQALHVTQAAISHQIKALEEWLGVPLFLRIGRGHGLALTEAGREYLPRVSAALDSIRSATASVTDRRKTRILSVASLDSFAMLWLLPRLNRFLRAHPEVDVRIVAADLDADALSRGEVQIDIRYGAGEWSGVEAVHFLSEDIFPVASPAIMAPERPLTTPDDLRHHVLLHDVMVIDWKTWLQAAGVEGVDAERGPGFNHSHLVTLAAVHGDGVALGRGAIVLDAIARGDLVRPFGLSLPSSFAYYAVYTRASADDPVVAAFRDWLLEEGRQSQDAMAALMPCEGD